MSRVHSLNSIRKLLGMLAAVCMAFCVFPPRAYAAAPLAAESADALLSSQSALSSAQSLKLGKWYSFSATYYEDEDDYYEITDQVYRVDLAQSGRVSVVWSSDASEGGFSLIDKSGEIYISNDSPDDSEPADLIAGTYYLEVSCVENCRFKVDFDSARESFAEAQGAKNDKPGTAVAISTGVKYRGQLAANDSVDYYKFKTTGSGVVRISVASEMETTDYKLSDTYGGWIASKSGDSDSRSGKQSFSWKYDLGRGAFLVKVESTESWDTGPYTIKVTELPDIADAQASIKKQTYTGQAIKPEFAVKYGGAELQLDTDYTVKFEDNKDVGTAKAILTGKGNYTGTKEIQFKIAPAKISKAQAASIDSVEYNWKKHTPKVALTFNDAKLKLDRDYTVKYEANKNAGTARVVVKGKGNFTGRKTITFKIERYRWYSFEPSSLGSFTYTGKAVKPKPYLTSMGRKLKLGRDYTLEYRNNKKVGTAKVLVKGKGNFVGTAVLTFKIKPVSLAKASATKIKAQTFKGKTLKPKTKVTYRGKTLKLRRDYTVKYKSNDYIGTASVILKGKGNYTGTKKLTFKIKADPKVRAAEKAVYKPLLSQAAEGSGDFEGLRDGSHYSAEYVLFDIDRNGTRELCVLAYSYGYQTHWRIYTVKSGSAIYLGQVGDHATLWSNTGKLYTCGWSGGYGSVGKVTLTGRKLKESALLYGWSYELLDKMDDLGAKELKRYKVTNYSAF